MEIHREHLSLCNHGFSSLCCRYAANYFLDIYIFIIYFEGILTIYCFAGSSKTIKLRSNCGFPVWPAIASWNTHNTDTPHSIPTMLNAGESSSITLDSSWSGSIWGRLQCTFDSNGIGLCESGDCGGTFSCDQAGAGKPMPEAITTATFTNGSSSVSLENGFNLGISLDIEQNHNDVNCKPMACNADVASVCPRSLRVGSYGCNGSCSPYFRSCSPPDFASAFQKACPQAFPFQEEAICSESTSFTLTFCPK